MAIPPLNAGLELSPKNAWAVRSPSAAKRAASFNLSGDTFPSNRKSSFSTRRRFGLGERAAPLLFARRAARL